MPNWLFAALMTAPVRFTGVAAVAVGPGLGLLVFGCNGVSLGCIDSGALGAAVLFSASLPQPMTMTHAAMTATRRIRINSFPRLRPYRRRGPSAGYVIRR